MQFSKNSKRLLSLSVGLIISSLLLAGCMDKVPGLIDRVDNDVHAHYYDHQSNKYEDIENSYSAAQSYCCGPNKKNDDVKALELYCRAAMAGHRASMIEIGRLYSHEVTAGPQSPIPYDRSLAYAYFSKAAENGYQYADIMKDNLDQSLTADEKVRAQKYVAEFPNIPCAISR